MKPRDSIPGYQTTGGMCLCTEEEASCKPFLGLRWLKPGDPSAVSLQHLGEDPGFLIDRAAESEATKDQKNLTCHLANI